MKPIKKLIIAALFIIVNHFATAQVDKYKESLKVKRNHCVRAFTTTTTATALNNNATLKKEESVSYNGEKFNAETEINLTSGTSVMKNSITTVTNPERRGKANIKQSNDTLYINYWLNKEYNEICDKKSDTFNECICNPPRDPNTYFILLKDRQYASFRHTRFEFGALTIPFKARWQSKKNNQSIPADFSIDFNASMYFGWAFGKTKFYYYKNHDKQPTSRMFSFGFFTGFSQVKLDSTNTYTDIAPVLKEKNVPALSLGMALMANIRSFSFGVFPGWDIVFGPTGSKWNYNGRPYLGFGIGYKINFNPKKE
jgi:hypothetical protein